MVVCKVIFVSNPTKVFWDFDNIPKQKLFNHFLFMKTNSYNKQVVFKQLHQEKLIV